MDQLFANQFLNFLWRKDQEFQREIVGALGCELKDKYLFRIKLEREISPYFLYLFNFFHTNSHMLHLIKNIRQGVSLFSIKSDKRRPREMIVHHGLMGSSKNFRTICKHPSISDYVNTNLIDCRNHGNSPAMSTHTIEDLADDLYEYIQTEREIGKESWDRIILMGHSMGGLALMGLTKRYPELQEFVQRVIIIDITANMRDVDDHF